MTLIRYVLVIAFFPLLALGKPLVLATFPIPLMVENHDRGLFVSLTKEIAKRNNREVTILVHPTAKTLLEFSNNKVHGFFPAMDIYIPKKIVRSSSFYQKVDYVFYKKGHPLKVIKDLEGKRVGLTFRYSYPPELMHNKKIKFEYAPDDILNMKKLGRGIIDAFIAEERSGLKALQLSAQKNIEFDKSFPLGRQIVYYAFQNTEEGRNLSEIFSKTIEAMIKDGSLNRLLTETP